jgi:hypothetical protein
VDRVISKNSFWSGDDHLILAHWHTSPQYVSSYNLSVLVQPRFSVFRFEKPDVMTLRSSDAGVTVDSTNELFDVNVGIGMVAFEWICKYRSLS